MDRRFNRINYNKMKKIVIFSTILFLMMLISCDKQEEKNLSKTNNQQEIAKVNEIMTTYKNAIQNLDTKNLEYLFSKDAMVFESGGNEGTFGNYLSHHLAPELKHFKSFNFSDYSINTKIDLPYAFVNESYIYTIEIKGDKDKQIPERTIKKKGIATTILKKNYGKWKIIQTHTSSRNSR